jgi:5-methyltetrahydrofolate--homocysteine methyltransferase
VANTPLASAPLNRSRRSTYVPNACVNCGYAATTGATSCTTGAQTCADSGNTPAGTSCGTNLVWSDFGEFAAAMSRVCGLPIVLQPNAGQPVLDGDRAVYQMTPEAFADGVAALASDAVGLLGGCCGTTPAHVAALVARL